MNISDFDQKLTICENLKQAESVLKQYLSAYHFSCYAFTYYAGHIKTGQPLHFDCVSQDLLPWHRYYLQEKYADVDRTLEQSFLQTKPLHWSVHEQLSQAKNIRERRIREESIEFGIDMGLSIPVHGPNGDFATMTLHQLQGEHCLKQYETLQYEWLAATHIFYHYIKKILLAHARYDQKAIPLSKREKQCLSLTAQDCRVEEIALQLNISPRTVNFHLQNANKKLGTRNKYQSIHRSRIDF